MRVSFRRTIVLAVAGGLLCALASVASAQAGGANAGGLGESYGFEVGGMRGVPTYGYESVGMSGGSVSGSAATEQSEQNAPMQRQGPPIPTSKELARFTDQQLQTFIARSANDFIRELGRFSTGDTWVDYFRLNDLKALASSAPGEGATMQDSSSGNPRGRSVIDTVLNRIASTEKNSEYEAVTSTWGFQALHAALKEAARSPDEREIGVLKGQAEVLDKSLERISTGEGWRKHLELESLTKLADQKSLRSNEETQRIEDRFDQVMRNPEYQAIVQLPGFSGVYGTLHQLTEGKQIPSTAKKAPERPEKATR